MKNVTSLVETRTFWSALFALVLIVANQFHWLALAGIAANPETVTNVLNFITFATVAGTMLFRTIATAKVTSVLPPSSTLPPASVARVLPLMFALAILTVVGSGLSGCAAVSAISGATGFAVTQNEIDALRSTYDGAFLTPARTYRQLGYCATGTSATLAKPCAVKSIVAQLVAADAIVAGDFDAVQALVTAGNNTGLAAAYQVLQTQITVAENLAVSLGVKS